MKDFDSVLFIILFKMLNDQMTVAEHKFSVCGCERSIDLDINSLKNYLMKDNWEIKMVNLCLKINLL